jgi:hypothetical protein
MSELPLSLTDAEITAIMSAARPLQPQDRSRFIEIVSRQLKGKLVGDGLLHRICREAQREVFAPPLNSAGIGKYAR